MMLKKVFLVFSILIIGLLAMAYFMPQRAYNMDDCLEFGFCAEGLELKDNGKPYTMTKEYCIENHYTWIEDTAVCNVRKTTY